ncbi:hypothetical protein ACWIUA_01610 [Ursidibacter sp. B-7004-1]
MAIGRTFDQTWRESDEGITGQVHQDRKLLTGDSPLASNNLGILAANELLKTVAE